MRLAAALAACTLAAGASAAGESSGSPPPASGSAQSSPTPSLTVPFFRQQKNGCGAASVAMVAHYWSPQSAPAPEAVYDRLIDAERKGILLAHMKSYFEELGFQAFTLKAQWTDLHAHLAKGRPIIVGLREGSRRRLHFAVLTGIEDEHVWLNDPTRKQTSRTGRARFEKQWAGADRWILLATPRASAARP